MTFRLPVSLRDGDDARCVAALTTYFHGSTKHPPYLGARFDTWGSRVEGRVTSDDLVAVGFLSVKVPSQAAVKLVAEPAPELAALLSHPDTRDRDLVEVDPASITPEWAPWQLYGHVRALPGVGPTIASKILARKCPRLLPIWDSLVGQVCGPSTGFWNGLAEALQADGGELHGRLVRLRREARLHEGISVLRTFDVIAWMEGKQLALARPGAASSER